MLLLNVSSGCVALDRRCANYGLQNASRVRTDPGKVWKDVEFNVKIFKALKSLEMIIGMEKSGKIIEKCNADLENTEVCNTVDYPCIC